MVVLVQPCTCKQSPVTADGYCRAASTLASVAYLVPGSMDVAITEHAADFLVNSIAQAVAPSAELHRNALLLAQLSHHPAVATRLEQQLANLATQRTIATVPSCTPPASAAEPQDSLGEGLSVEGSLEIAAEA